MTNWCKQNALLLLIISSFWTGQSSNVADSIVTKGVDCRNVNIAYQKVYSFETENYRINICQLNSKFYYYRQSKLDTNNHLLIPAEALVRGTVFKAMAEGITYFVGIDGDRYYSSVMSNNNEIVFEPEIPSSVVSAQNVAQVSDRLTLPIDYSFNQADDHSLNNASWKLDHPQANSKQMPICTPKKIYGSSF